MADLPSGIVTFLIIRALLPEARDGLTVRDLGERRPKDLSQPQSL
jgi:hypothetical protein